MQYTTWLWYRVDMRRSDALVLTYWCKILARVPFVTLLLVWSYTDRAQCRNGSTVALQAPDFLINSVGKCNLLW